MVLTIHRLLLRQECAAPCESARWIKRRFGKQTTTLDFSQGGSPETTTLKVGEELHLPKTATNSSWRQSGRWMELAVRWRARGGLLYHDLNATQAVK